MVSGAISFMRGKSDGVVGSKAEDDEEEEEWVGITRVTRRERRPNGRNEKEEVHLRPIHDPPSSSTRFRSSVVSPGEFNRAFHCGTRVEEEAEENEASDASTPFRLSFSSWKDAVDEDDDERGGGGGGTPSPFTGGVGCRARRSGPKTGKYGRKGPDIMECDLENPIARDGEWDVPASE